MSVVLARVACGRADFKEVGFLQEVHCMTGAVTDGLLQVEERWIHMFCFLAAELTVVSSHG